MPQVNVTINGRQFRMACEEGEELHLLRLAAELISGFPVCGSASGRLGTRD